MVCLVDEMHLGTDGQATAGTIPSLLFPPLTSHFAILHLNFFLVYLNNILAVYDLTFLSILMKILVRIPKG